MPQTERPLIGVSGSDQTSRLLRHWIVSITKALGARARSLTPMTQAGYRDCDGYILTGGIDLHPVLYHESPREENYPFDRQRDHLEWTLLDHAEAEKKPVLGICRGMQMLNVYAGGTLFQEVGDVLENFFPTRSVVGKCLTRRPIRIRSDSQLYRILGDGHERQVNSLHHQGVNRCGEGLEVSAREDNGLIQALETRPGSTPCWLGVQWHPELMIHRLGDRNLFRHLIQSAAR